MSIWQARELPIDKIAKFLGLNVAEAELLVGFQTV